ncbi:MAG: AraC family transcriptional regulator [Burkholderiales bacterium]|nr:AraC family transcriptional regulator [Burkholderiales bacterium]
MSTDRLTPLFRHFRARAHLFHAGALCGITRYDAALGTGFLHVLRAGRLELRHHGRRAGLPARLVLERPTLLFYPRPVDHQFLCSAEDGADLVCAALAFDGGGQHPLARALPPLLVITLDELAPLRMTLELLFAEADAVRCGQPLLADRLAEVLLIQLLRWLLDHPGRQALPAGLVNGLAHPGLARALAAMHERPAEPWTLPALAALAAMSRSAFAPAFRQAVGQTPGEYLAQWRLALAQQRLARGEPLHRVADAVGYGSAATLSRAFSARTGLSPRVWLQQRAAEAA